MARKYSYQRLGNLWKKNSSAPQVVCGSRESYVKKAIDDVCLKADLGETTWDYSYQLCSGMIRLLELGLGHKELCSHPSLAQKLLRLGRDIMENANSDSDLFYLGALVDLKICSKWRNIEFYRFLVNALDGMKRFVAYLSSKIKERIRKDYEEQYPKDYAFYFTPFLAASFKDSA